MADSPNTALTLGANYKEVYAEDLKDLRPAKYILQKNFKFKTSAKLGREYHQPVLLAREAGFTWATTGLSSTPTVTYADAVPSTIKDATIDGSQIFGHSFIDFEAAARGEASAHAFKNSVGIVIESLWDASQHRQECDLWYGQTELGIIGTATSDTVMIISDASWAPAIWTASEGATLTVKNAAGTTDRGDAVISKVDVAAKTLTVGSGLTSIAATDRIFWGPGGKGQIDNATSATMFTMSGIVKILSTVTGSILNISTNYSKWCPVTFSAGGNCTLPVVQDCVQRLVQKGLDEDVTLIVSTKTWTTMCTDWAALTRFNEGTGTYTLGAEALKIRSNGVKVDVVASPFCKEGIAIMTPMSQWFRIGASDITADIPGRGGQELFTLVHGTNTYEFQTYQHLALFGMPGQSALITGITNT